VTTKLEAILVAVLLAMGAAWYWTSHERSVGAAKCVASDAKAVTTEGTKNAAAEGRAGEIVKQEATDHANAITAPIAPVAALGMQHGAQPFHCRPAVPAPTPGPLADVDPLRFIRITGPSGYLPDDLNAHFEREVQRAHAADDTIEKLRDYALRVCPRPK